MLAQPAQSLTDLALGLVTVLLGLRLSRAPASHGPWRAAFYWFGVAALLGAVHHGVFVRWPRAAELSWGVVSVLVVVGVSYVLAGTVADVLGPGRARAFWLLRSAGFLAYVGMVASGHAGVAAILWCESLTMISVLALWVWAAFHGNLMAPMALVAIGASLAAAGTKALNPHMLQTVHLDPTSVYHLAQIVGTVLLYVAVKRSLPAEGTVGAHQPQSRPRLAEVRGVVTRAAHGVPPWRGETG
jgi:hypothetical protein